MTWLVGGAPTPERRGAGALNKRQYRNQMMEPEKKQRRGAMKLAFARQEVWAGAAQVERVLRVERRERFLCFFSGYLGNEGRLVRRGRETS